MIHPVVINPVINPVVRVMDPVAWRAGKAGYPSGAILHFDATLGFVDQTGNQTVTLIGSVYPSVVAGYAVNASGKEWGFDITTGPVRTALLAGEVTLVQVVTLPLRSTLTDATDYSLFGDLLYVRRDGTAGSFKCSDGTNVASVAYDWSEGEVVRVVVQANGSHMQININTPEPITIISSTNLLKWSNDTTKSPWAWTNGGGGTRVGNVFSFVNSSDNIRQTGISASAGDIVVATFRVSAAVEGTGAQFIIYNSAGGTGTSRFIQRVATTPTDYTLGPFLMTSSGASSGVAITGWTDESGSITVHDVKFEKITNAASHLSTQHIITGASAVTADIMPRYRSKELSLWGDSLALGPSSLPVARVLSHILRGRMTNFNYFESSEHPTTRTITLPSGPWTFWMPTNEAGSVAVTAGTAVAAATSTHPLPSTVTYAAAKTIILSTGGTVTLTFTAPVTNFCIENQLGKTFYVNSELYPSCPTKTYQRGVGGQTSSAILSRFLSEQDRHNDLTIIWSGSNDVIDSGDAAAAQASILANIAAMVEEIGHGEFVVLSIMNNSSRPVGTFGGDMVVSVNAALTAAYPNNYVDVRAYLMTKGDGGANDNSDIASGIVPRSLRTDTIHLNNDGGCLVASKVASFIAEKAWDAPFTAATLTAPLPLSAQINKSHTAPIGTGKITIFEGVATSSQIEEAR